MRIKTQYDIGQDVYLCHDPEQRPRRIVEITIVSVDVHHYLLRCGTDESLHYEHELSVDKNNTFL